METARARAATVGLGDRARFELGDAERLPVDDAAFDAAVCECAFCTFPDKATAAAELFRAVRPGGRVGISDVAGSRPTGSIPSWPASPDASRASPTRGPSAR